jgi:hypothetical protein
MMLNFCLIHQKAFFLLLHQLAEMNSGQLGRIVGFFLAFAIGNNSDTAN